MTYNGAPLGSDVVTDFEIVEGVRCAPVNGRDAVLLVRCGKALVRAVNERVDARLRLHLIVPDHGPL
jgi:hypothetical protein